MKKIILIFCILCLIIATTITKNSTKNLENNIFNVSENLSLLKNKYEYILLDYNFLTSPQKLMNYQSKYFDKDLVIVDINKIQTIIKKDSHITTLNMDLENNNE